MRLAFIFLPLLLALSLTWPLFNWRTLLPLLLLALTACAAAPAPLPAFPPIIQEEEPFTPPRLKQMQYEVSLTALCKSTPETFKAPTPFTNPFNAPAIWWPRRVYA